MKTLQELQKEIKDVHDKVDSIEIENRERRTELFNKISNIEGEIINKMESIESINKKVKRSLLQTKTLGISKLILLISNQPQIQALFSFIANFFK